MKTLINRLCTPLTAIEPNFPAFKKRPPSARKQLIKLPPVSPENKITFQARTKKPTRETRERDYARSPN